MRWLWLLLLMGCPWEAPVPLARVQHGPAYRDPTPTLAALPVMCTTHREPCTAAYAAAVSSATQMTLEFIGYSVVDTGSINAEMRRRSTREQIDPRVEGATWNTLPAPEQRALLRAMGIAGMLRTEILMGRPHGMSAQFTVQISVTVERLDGDMVWHSECRAETGDYHSTEQAMDIATRCALEAGSLW